MSHKSGFIARLGAIMNRAALAVSHALCVAAANSWRDYYNPLRSLTIARAVMLLEAGERGAYAELQWTYRYIEMQDATLGALIERRTSAIQELDWNIKIRAKIPAGKQQVAKRQAAALQDAYDKIGNLSEAFEAMALATFRGFSRLEKIRDADGNLVKLSPVDQWFWCRRGLYGAWQYNRNSAIGAIDGEEIDESRFVSREVSRPVNRVALIAAVRKGASQKDWDGFIETFGIPAVFVIMPENLPEGKEEEYLSTAEQVTSDARGVLPAGADIKTVDNGARGVNPFKDHLQYQDEQVVLRGTGGKLTMLAESGSGTLAGGAHSDTFAAIARAEAKEISEILQQCIDAEIIEAVTPGERAFAYFELANEETDPAQLVKDITSMEAAGLETDVGWIEEKTGYPVTRRLVNAATIRLNEPPGPAATQQIDAIENQAIHNSIHNREITDLLGDWINNIVKNHPSVANREPAVEPAVDPALQGLRDALASDLQPLGDALHAAVMCGDDAAMRAELKKISARMPDFLESPALTKFLAEQNVTALTTPAKIPAP